MSTTTTLLEALGAGLNIPFPRHGGKTYFVDGTLGAAGNSGLKPSLALSTIQGAMNKVSEGDNIVVLPKRMTLTSTDPVSYAETVIVNVPNVSIIGISRGRTQGGLPQIKIGAGSTAMFEVKAPGCYFTNLGINGDASTGGGIKITDDGGSTSSVFGLTIENCHFKNCAAHATNGKLGGAIYWGSNGGGWQVRINNNRFYKNLADIVLVGTGVSVPQDVVIEGNTFSGPAASVDGNVYLAGGSGINGVVIDRNIFSCFPAAVGGTIAAPVELTGCVGVLTNNMFATSGKTFGAAANVKVPVTVFMMNNYQEAGTTQIVRT